MFVRLALVAALSVVGPLAAQVPENVQVPPDIDTMQRPDEPQARPVADDVAAAEAARPAQPRTDAPFASTNGELNLDGPSDIQLKVFTGPIRFFTNSTSTPGSGVERMRIWADTGNVSIGTQVATAPNRKLVVSGSGPGGAFQGVQSNTYSANGTDSQASTSGAMYMTVNEGVTLTGTMHGLMATSYLFDKGTVTNVFGVSGYAGVYPGAANTGTISNAYGFYSSVKRGDGAILNGFGLAITDVQATNDWAIYQSGTDDENYFAGRVGIGTAFPADMLHLSAASPAIRMTHTSPTSSNNWISFYENGTLYGFINQRGSTHATEPKQFNVGNADLGGSTALYAGGAARVFATAAGNVGIGTNTPTEKLHVNGNVHASGNLTVVGNINASTITGTAVIGARYQDLAEWVPATSDMDPGTVVVLNLERTNEVMPSHRAYDTSVAGVVSAQPGILLGEAGDEKEQIATTGRVRVKVDASQAPIRVGDLLVTSSTPGVAMRSEPLDLGGVPIHRPGTIIGKALEPLESGVGEILVLLSLQ